MRNLYQITEQTPKGQLDRLTCRGMYFYEK
jgi:hypothetical protein